MNIPKERLRIFLFIVCVAEEEKQLSGFRKRLRMLAHHGCDHEKCNICFLLVVTFYRVMLYLKCPSIHGSVTSALLGVLLLHLRYFGIKLPPAVFLSLKGGKKKPNPNY